MVKLKTPLLVVICLIATASFLFVCRAAIVKDSKERQAAILRKLELKEFRKTFMALCLNDGRPVYQCMAMYSEIKPSDWQE